MSLVKLYAKTIRIECQKLPQFKCKEQEGNYLSNYIFERLILLSIIIRHEEFEDIPIGWFSSRIGFNKLSSIRITTDRWTRDFPVASIPSVLLFANNGIYCARVSCRLCHVLQRAECIQTKAPPSPPLPRATGFRPREMQRFRGSALPQKCRKK